MATSTHFMQLPSMASAFEDFEQGKAPLEGGVQRRNSSFVPRISLPVNNGHDSQNLVRPKSAKFSSSRIRSNSGLALHLQALDLRQYTDYLPDGSPKSPLYRLSDGSTHSLAQTSSESVNLTASVVPSVPESELPIPDIQGKEALDLAMKNPETANKLWRLAASQGCEDKVEFLMKVNEYTQSLEAVVAQLSDISTTHTSVAATSPLGLPSQLSRSLNTNLKHLASSLLPGLENLFLEPKDFVEQRLAKDIFPGFVKQQLTLCAAMGLTIDTDPENPASNYIGLGTAFCLTDPNQEDYPITFVSDGFEQLTGYSRYEVVSKNCSFLQGPATDEATVSRIRQALERKEESLEIILNYRRDGKPFWNLLFLCPLVDSSGQLRQYLGAQIDVSSLMKGSRDLQKMFTYDPIGAARRRDRARSLARGDYDHDYDRDDVFRQDGFQMKGSKMNFFKQFKKTSSAASLAESHRSFDKPEFNFRQDADKFSNMRTAPLGLSAGDMLKPYSRIMLLSLSATALASPSNVSLDRDMTTSEGFLGKLTVFYCSQEALDIFGTGVTREAVMQKDIFQLLYEYGNSPSITKVFRAAVRNAVLRDGKSISIEVAVARGPPRRPNLDRRGSSAEDPESQRMAKASKAAAKGGDRSGFERIMSHWTPLKGSDSDNQLILLALAPALV